MSRQKFKKFKTLVEQSKKVLVSTHVLPDGDGLGAEVALFHYLKKAGKSCRVYNPDPLPPRYRFLDPDLSFLHGPQEGKPWEKFDLWIIADTNDPRRLGALWEDLSIRAKKIVFVDHHPKILGAARIKYPPHALVFSDTESSSIGELLYHLFQQLKLTKLNQKIATGLYVSVMTDTNSFRYSRTTPEAHQIAAEMIQLGVNPEDIYQSIYSSKEISHIQLLGILLQNVKISSNESIRAKIAWLEMPAELRKKHQATADDTQSFLNLLLLIRDAEVICLFREENDGKIRVSIKSKGKVVINKIAMELGGGGHEFAAGVGLSLPLKEAVNLVISKVEEQINNHEKKQK